MYELHFCEGSCTINDIKLCRLLYAVFVVSSENSTVAELASTLQADLSQLQAAASFVCRLGWAEKIIDPASILQESAVPGISSVTLGDDENSMGSANMATDGSAFRQGDVARTENSDAHVAFVVDANITSYLMMGSVSPGWYILFTFTLSCTAYRLQYIEKDIHLSFCKVLFNVFLAVVAVIFWLLHGVVAVFSF